MRCIEKDGAGQPYRHDTTWSHRSHARHETARNATMAASNRTTAAASVSLLPIVSLLHSTRRYGLNFSDGHFIQSGNCAACAVNSGSEDTLATYLSGAVLPAAVIAVTGILIWIAVTLALACAGCNRGANAVPEPLKDQRAAYFRRAGSRYGSLAGLELEGLYGALPSDEPLVRGSLGDTYGSGAYEFSSRPGNTCCARRCCGGACMGCGHGGCCMPHGRCHGCCCSRPHKRFALFGAILLGGLGYGLYRAVRLLEVATSALESPADQWHAAAYTANSAAQTLSSATHSAQLNIGTLLSLLLANGAPSEFVAETLSLNATLASIAPSVQPFLVRAPHVFANVSSLHSSIHTAVDATGATLLAIIAACASWVLLVGITLWCSCFSAARKRVWFALAAWTAPLLLAAVWAAGVAAAVPAYLGSDACADPAGTVLAAVANATLAADYTYYSQPHVVDAVMTQTAAFYMTCANASLLPSLAAFPASLPTAAVALPAAWNPVWASFITVNTDITEYSEWSPAARTIILTQLAHVANDLIPVNATLWGAASALSCASIAPTWTAAVSGTCNELLLHDLVLVVTLVPAAIVFTVLAGFSAYLCVQHPARLREAGGRRGASASSSFYVARSGTNGSRPLPSYMEGSSLLSGTGGFDGGDSGGGMQVDSGEAGAALSLNHEGITVDAASDSVYLQPVPVYVPPAAQPAPAAGLTTSRNAAAAAALTHSRNSAMSALAGSRNLGAAAALSNSRNTTAAAAPLTASTGLYGSRNAAAAAATAAPPASLFHSMAASVNLSSSRSAAMGMGGGAPAAARVQWLPPEVMGGIDRTVPLEPPPSPPLPLEPFNQMSASLLASIQAAQPIAALGIAAADVSDPAPVALDPLPAPPSHLPPPPAPIPQPARAAAGPPRAHPDTTRRLNSEKA